MKKFVVLLTLALVAISGPAFATSENVDLSAEITREATVITKLQPYKLTFERLNGVDQATAITGQRLDGDWTAWMTGSPAVQYGCFQVNAGSEEPLSFSVADLKASTLTHSNGVDTMTFPLATTGVTLWFDNDGCVDPANPTGGHFAASNAPGQINAPLDGELFITYAINPAEAADMTSIKTGSFTGDIGINLDYTP